MVNSVPIAIIVIGVILVVIVLLAWRRHKWVELEKINTKKKAFFAQWITGIVLAAIAAIFMFHGSILGENTTNISTVMGLIGICLIGTSNINLLSFKRK